MRKWPRKVSRSRPVTEDLSAVYLLCTIVPVTTPDRVNPSCVAEMVQVIALGADPFVVWLVDVCPSKEKVRSSMVGTKMPVPPDENVRWATFQVVAACALPLSTTKVPVSPLGQSKVPDKPLGVCDGAAAATDVPNAAPSPMTPASTPDRTSRRAAR